MKKLRASQSFVINYRGLHSRDFLVSCYRQLGGNHGDVEAVSVKDRVKAFEGSAGANGSQDQDLKPKKKKPQSKAFAEFENTGLIIGFVSIISFL